MGAPWLQPVAISRKSTECRSGRNKPKPLPWVATSCRSERMVEEGGLRFESGRGLCKSAARRRFLVHADLRRAQRAVGMEPFMELSR
jgi:hypothetical protein